MRYSKDGGRKMGRMVETFYRKCGDYQVRIGVVLTSQGYRAWTFFIDSLDFQPEIEYVSLDKNEAISLVLLKLAELHNKFLIEKEIIKRVDWRRRIH